MVLEKGHRVERGAAAGDSDGSEGGLIGSKYNGDVAGLSEVEASGRRSRRGEQEGERGGRGG